MPILSAIQSQLTEHEQWLIGLRQDPCMTLAKIKAALQNQKGVTASPSQLETYFRNLGQRKNLSRHDWIAVFRALDSQKSFGRIFDLYISGKLITEQSLQKKRKNAKPAQTLASCLADADRLLTQLPDGVTVKLRSSQDSSGSSSPRSLSTPQLVLHPGSGVHPNGEPNMLLASISANKDAASRPSAINAGTDASSISTFSRIASACVADQARPADSPARMEADLDHNLEIPEGLHFWISPPSFELNNDSMDLEIESRASFFVSSSSTPDIWTRRSLLVNLQHSLWLQDSVGQNDLLAVGPAEIDTASLTNVTNSDRIHWLSLIEFARRVEQFGGTAYRRGHLATNALLPRAEKILDNLLSLVSVEDADEDFHGSLNVTRGAEAFTDPFVKLFFFSIANNFAGFEFIHNKAIMKFINQYEPVRSSIMSHVRDRGSTTSSIALVGNLLQAAIAAGDTKTVQSLLASRIINPDDIACTEFLPCNHHMDTVIQCRRTPLELASRLRHFDIVGLLLQFGADVNKTYKASPSGAGVLGRENLGQGALECAIGTWGQYSQIEFRLVDLLLDNGATVSGRLAVVAVRWGDPKLIAKLMARLSPTEHVDCFYDLLSDAAEYLKNDIGHQIIRQVIQACRDTHDNMCIRSNRRAVVNAMAKASRRKNNDLVCFLLPHGGQDGLDRALTAALRSGSHSLVHLLLAHGARGDGPACSIDGPGEQNTGPTTPLAEAIRVDNAELVDILAKEGAWDQIAEPGRLGAAMHAIAETGNLGLLLHVLQLVPNPEPRALTRPLRAAIRFGHEEIALRLLEAGADDGCRSEECPLLEALRMKSESITWAILDHEATVNFSPRYDSIDATETALESATKWGNRQIIKALVLMGADINSYQREAPLSIAIKSGERPLIELLINLGADLNTKSMRNLSPRPSFFPLDDDSSESGSSFLDDDSSEPCSSPLAAAALVRDVDVANYLLEHGADPADEQAILKAFTHDQAILNLILHKLREKYPNGRTGFGGRVLQHGLQTQNEALLDLCLSARFDVNNFARHQIYENVTALGMAIKKYRGGRLDLISKLLDAGGDVDVPTSERHELSSVQYRDMYSIFITVRQTAFLDAIETKSLPLVELLISKGADVRKEAKLGLKRTPLQKACEVASHTIVDLLLELNVDVNAAPAARGGGTALQLAAKAGSLRIAKKLLAFGADVNAPVRFGGRSAIEYAAQYGRFSMIQLLWNAAGGRLAATEYESAIVLAQENGHPACAVQLRNLSSGNRGYIDSAGMADDGGGANLVP